MNQATPYLTEILERGTRGWFLHFREKLILELRQQKIADDQIEKVSIIFFRTLICCTVLNAGLQF